MKPVRPAEWSMLFSLKNFLLREESVLWPNQEIFLSMFQKKKNTFVLFVSKKFGQDKKIIKGVEASFIDD